MNIIIIQYLIENPCHTELLQECQMERLLYFCICFEFYLLHLWGRDAYYYFLYNLDAVSKLTELLDTVFYKTVNTWNRN